MGCDLRLAHKDLRLDVKDLRTSLLFREHIQDKINKAYVMLGIIGI